MNSSNTAPPPTLWDLILAAMSVLTIALLTIMMVAPLDDASKQIIQWADLTICGFFFVDFIRRLVTAPNALRYLKWGWIDLIACIPMVDQLRWARLFRVFQLIRILRGAKASAHLIRTLGAFPRSTSLTIGITTLGQSPYLRPNTNMETLTMP
jgi:voltage-gated potassium channel